MILNLGCGDETYGDVRVDFVKTATTTMVLDLNKPLPFEDESFDEVYSRSVLEHIKNVGVFTSEMLRVLKPKGKLWLRTDNANYLAFYFKSHQSFIENTYKHHTIEDRHYYLFKKEHLINLFGLKLIGYDIKYTCPNKKLFFLPQKLKCMHLEIEGLKW